MAENTNEAVSTDPMEIAYKRLGGIMFEMRKASASGDKARLIHMSEAFMEHGDDIIAHMFESSGITEGDIQSFGSNSLSDGLMIKMASKPDGEMYLKKTAEADSRRE
jgi:hypothetical protein